jgi:hypothetical protein
MMITMMSISSIYNMDNATISIIVKNKCYDAECRGTGLWVPRQTPESAFSRNAHQNFFCVLASDDVGEVAEVGGADFPDVEEGIDAECREPFQKHGLRHILPDQWRHLAQKLDKRKMFLFF